MKLNTDKFISKSKDIHGNKYDYSLVEYINNREKVKIICPIHGVFEQNAAAHLRGQICKKCNDNNYRLNKNIFIEKSKGVHGNKYDYSLIKYKNNKSKVKIICPIHGVFEQRVDSHLQGRGCKKCAIEYKKNKLKNKNFIEKAKDVHADKYDYSLVEYINNREKVKIICPIHGVFEQIPYSHLKGMGCYICKDSIGENIIDNYLSKQGIRYNRQKKFKNCKNKKHLKFDFYIPDKNLCIEYNGKQHYESVDYFGGEKTLSYIKKNDFIKKDFCKKQNIKLKIIKYDDNILKKIENIIYDKSN
jgi:hypothetical protein